MTDESDVTESDPLADNVEQLVGAARAVAENSFLPMLEKHPFLEGVGAEEWKFVVTGAAIYIALEDLRFQIRSHPDRFGKLLRLLGPPLAHWSTQGEACIMNCKSFVAKTTTNAQVSPSIAVGTWILMSTLERQPTAQEIVAAPEICAFVAGHFSGFWEADSVGEHEFP